MTKRTCTVEGCVKDYDCRGLCSTHYSRFRLHGTTEPSPKFVPQPCAATGCERTVHANGFCTRHNDRFRKYGTPDDLDTTYRTPTGRLPVGVPRREFARLIAIESDECVLWPHARSSNGYGQLRVARTHIGVHVLALEARVGPKPTDDAVAAHAPVICHNKLCINYRHLRWATAADNIGDQLADGTRRWGETHHRAKVTLEQVRSIRARFAAGETRQAITDSVEISRKSVNAILGNRSWRRAA